jgi:hypothetical protein
MNESSFASLEVRVYRLNWFWRIYHFAFGGAFMIGAVMLGAVMRPDDPAILIAVGIALFSVFMISRPLIMAVTVDQSSVTFRGTFSARSLQRSSITAVETKSGKSSFLILWGNTIDGNERLEIPMIFAFDEAWDSWLRAYRDLDKPLSLS